MNVTDFEADDWLGLSWQPWRSLNPPDGDLGEITQQPGLYRVRHRER